MITILIKVVLCLHKGLGNSHNFVYCIEIPAAVFISEYGKSEILSTKLRVIMSKLDILHDDVQVHVENPPMT